MSCKTNFSAFSHKNLSVLFKRRSRFPIFDTVICIVIAWFVVIFGINTKSDISKLFYVISGAIRRVKFETILKYHAQILLLFVYTTTRKRFVIFTCRYFKLSWNTTALSQSVCRNFSCINSVILLHEKSLQFDWLRVVVFQLNLKYLHVKITNLLRVVV